MTKNNKRRCFTKEDLFNLVFSLRKNAQIFYKSGFTSLEDFLANSNTNLKKDFFRFLVKNYENKDLFENMIFIFYKDKSFYIEENRTHEYIHTTNTPKTQLEDVKRWFLKDAIDTQTECQLCCREIIKFENPRVFNIFYKVCGRCGYLQCIDCVFNLNKHNKATECVQCKLKYIVEFHASDKKHSTFLHNMHHNMSEFLNNEVISLNEYEQWTSMYVCS